jgi:hypothetical protein
VSENADIDPQQHYRQPNAVFRNLRNGTFQGCEPEVGPAWRPAQRIAVRIR